MRLTPHRLKPCAPSDLRAGEHIAVRRPEGYVHHGISLAPDRVAHFTDEAGFSGKRHACVTESSLESFLQGGRLLRRRHARGYPREMVLARAQGVLRGGVHWKPYHLMRNNCEHFATFCAARRVRSVQVEQVASVAALATTAMVAVLLNRRSGPGA